MTVTFFIGPFDPALWAEGDPAEAPTSDLRIDPHTYAQHLRAHWPHLKEYRPDVDNPSFVYWVLHDATTHGIEVHLHSDQQYVSFTWTGNNFLEFILWHRAFVPTEYSLFLFNSAAWDSLILRPDTTVQEITEITGIQSA